MRNKSFCWWEAILGLSIRLLPSQTGTRGPELTPLRFICSPAAGTLLKTNIFLVLSERKSCRGSLKSCGCKVFNLHQTVIWM